MRLGGVKKKSFSIETEKKKVKERKAIYRRSLSISLPRLQLRFTIMGQYSYSQPSSSSNSQDLNSLLQAEAEMYAAEAEISQWNAEAIHNEPSPEGDDGIPRTCYCGSEPVHGYSQTPKDPYRRYITCPNADDGDCHVWKWWDVAVEEEMRDIQTELSELKGEANEREQKLLILEKRIGEFTKKKSGAKLMVFTIVLVGLVLLINVLG
ncbi:uncharacterized protein LOC111198862 [Brassica napus]|uniref:uncharacterized protein LOC111198862 n=1 Tax=Brassica napus TaxID=3708 RepID=UPI0020786BE4|nr:uncharacterized protein LOC111198862 [Brassica napus]